MHFDLVAETNTGSCVLCDQTAIGQMTPEEVLGRSLEDVQMAGRIFVYEMGDNGSCKFSIFIDEDLPESFCRRSYRTTKDVGLQIPSGQLVASGVEYLSKGESTIEHKPVQVPAGDYELTVHLIEPTENELVPDETTFDKASRWGCIVSLLLLLVGGGALLAGTSVLGWPLLGLLVTYWMVYLLWYNLSGKREQEEAGHRRTVIEGSPDVVVRMTRTTIDSERQCGRISI